MLIEIRPATPSDAAAILRLNEAFNDVRATEAEIRAQLVRCQGIETLLLAEVDGQAVGFLCLRLLPQSCDPATYAEVSELFVDKGYRRHGVGQALMERAVDLAKAAGAKELILLTSFRNTVAQRFYHTQGFENYGISMRKPLD
jgi:GNAT superfamily N-acetyltransferase